MVLLWPDRHIGLAACHRAYDVVAGLTGKQKLGWTWKILEASTRPAEGARQVEQRLDASTSLGAPVYKTLDCLYIQTYTHTYIHQLQSHQQPLTLNYHNTANSTAHTALSPC
jgi:hypothetical protein